MSRRGGVTVLVVALLAGLFGFAVVAYLVSEKRSTGTATQSRANGTQANTASPAVQAGDNSRTQDNTPSPANETGDPSFISEVFGGGEPLPGGQRAQSWLIIIPRILVRLGLATLLAAMLAFRPRREQAGSHRNLNVAQTQILLAVVASALMMIVGDNAARAFGIFAAVSLVRFRTNIRDPKDITVLLISLSIGLATGVGRWDLAIILALFVLPLLWLLESKEPEQIFRSMELTVKTYNPELMQETLRKIFERYHLSTELRQIDLPDKEDALGCIMYSVAMNLRVSTDRLSEEIRAADPKNVDAIEWDQKKDNPFVFQ